MRNWIRRAVAIVTVALAACGGGGGGGSTEAPPAAVTISGFVWLGPVSGANVELLAVDANGTTRSLATTRSGADGAYAFTATPAAGAVFMVSATGGSYVEPTTATSRTLGTRLRAMDVWAGAARRVTLSAYSEIAVRSIERGTVPDWSAAGVRAANTLAADWVGLDSLLDFKPLDLRSTPSGTPTEAELAAAFATGAFQVFAQRLDANAATSIASGLDALAHLVLIDEEDDRLLPAFVGATVDFVDLTSLPAEARRSIKSFMLFGSTTPLSDQQLESGKPRGVSSGAASAAMPDDGFQLLGENGARTHFNRRGALVGYTNPRDAGRWWSLLTASVGELYGDGDIGIGRWNGGTLVISSRPGTTGQETVVPLVDRPFPYAVARAATAVPACGSRQLAMVGATEGALQSLASGASRLFTGLTADSRVGLQYLGTTYLGADIGLRLPDGSVVRYRSAGGADAPWASYTGLGLDTMLLEPVPPAGALANQNLELQWLVSGAGAGKAAVRLKLAGTNNETWATAAFAAAAGPADAAGCGQQGSPGPGVTPRPVDGEHFVFLDFNTQTSFLGAPRESTFGPAGELQTTPGFALQGAVFDAAGGADASIGRRVVSTPFEPGQARSEPYAVLRPGDPGLPANGTVEYELVAATAPVLERGSDTATVLPGVVGSATLKITLGQYPLGTPNAALGTVQVLVQGQIAGVPFVFSSDNRSTTMPQEGIFRGQTFDGSQFKGGVSAVQGDTAALIYHGSAGGAQVAGALLFRRR